MSVTDKVHRVGHCVVWKGCGIADAGKNPSAGQTPNNRARFCEFNGRTINCPLQSAPKPIDIGPDHGA
jgi:hypothetical protein